MMRHPFLYCYFGSDMNRDIKIYFFSLSSSASMSSSASKSFLYFIKSRSILGFTLYNNSEISLDISSAFLVVDKLIIFFNHILYTI